jgi:predicted ATPase/DNA-binding CsgD family transcriptional regulator
MVAYYGGGRVGVGDQHGHDEPLTRAGPDWPAGLPMPLTRLIGRRRELAEVARLVAANRLVSLVGAGGVGKTRLAVEAAAAVAHDFGDGAELVDLSAVADPALVPDALARSLGVEDRSGDSLRERMVRVLRRQHRLVVLDNCEHLRGGCAELATALLGSCPGVAVLATSRERLGVPGEVTWRVPSLTFPWPEHPPAPEDAEDFEAIALFAERARAACPGLEIGASEMAAITAICFRLDGIPLALELAAARAGTLSLAEIADRLTGRFGLLARSGVGPARHQTLRASVEWSYHLLSEPERVLFARLGVFAGGWTLDAAEAVCSVPPLPADQIAALLATLADKSLVHVEVAGQVGRYRLLEVIRAFAEERLAEAGELEDMRARHAGYYAGRAERAGPMLLGPAQAAWADWLDQETGNLRAARRWCGADRARAGTGLRLAAGLWEYWHIRGHLAEGAAWLAEALAPGGGPEGARAAALNGLGVLVSLQGADPARPKELFTASVESFRKAGDRPGESRAWTHLGNARALSGDPSGAVEAFACGLDLAREVGDTWLEAFALFLSGWAATLSGDVAGARSRVTAAAPVFDQIGDRRGAGYSALGLADCLIRQGQPDQALVVARDGIAVFEALPERWGLLYGASLMAEACGALGDWPRAAMLLGIIDTLGERIGGQPFPHQRAGLDELASRAATQLGPAWPGIQEAGRVIGRGDQITAALWPAASQDPESGRDDGLPLTRREREIADLITHGLTNRQIAARLVISERTVDTHVGRILAKLGCTSRSQAAAIITTATAATR